MGAWHGVQFVLYFLVASGNDMGKFYNGVVSPNINGIAFLGTSSSVLWSIAMDHLTVNINNLQPLDVNIRT